MKGAPRSEQFDDIYFSAKDGLAETEHVFVRGNDLPAAWNNKKQFTICETGFGTGLNFLTVWKLFEETSNVSHTLDFISFEKYPLKSLDIKEILSPWADYFGKRIDTLCDEYPLRVAGFHRIKISPQITLTLVFDDVNAAIPQLNAGVDCWFLDGFSPAKNPDMWSDIVFQNMKRLSVPSASFATFTAARFVLNGLEDVGFSVQKEKGFGYKSDMMTGHFNGQGAAQPLKYGKRIAVIGGGLAGTSCAFTLKQYGFDPVIYEREKDLATGASGNSLGMFNPRFCAQRDDKSDFFVPAFAQLHRLARKEREKIDFNPCGALHLMNSPAKEKRFQAVLQNWMWHEDHIQFLSAAEASEVAGIAIDEACLYLPDSGAISPHKLCNYMGQDIEVKTLSAVENINDIEADAVIICNAFEAKNFVDWLPVRKIRGQITEIETPSTLKNLKANIHYGGYVSATQKDTNVIGATFEQWIDHQEVMEEGHHYNIEKLMSCLPVVKDTNFKVKDGRARFRTDPKDHFPIVGAVPNHDNVFIAVAFGSHGLVGSVQSAHLLSDFLRGGPICLPQHTVNALNPQRFLDRARKKQPKSH